MCTVTYIPSDKGFILTANRDEFADRKPASFPNTRASKRGEVTFPADGDAGGTWIATSPSLTVSLLNGNYNRDPNITYRKSRGLVALDPFDFDSVDEYLEQANFEGINGFKMLLIEEEVLTEITWDGNQLTRESHKPEIPNIWVSIPKKFQHILEWRKSAFRQFLTNNPKPNPSKIREFHQIKTDPTGLGTQIEKNNMVFTVSMTQVRLEEKNPEISYCSFK